MDGETSPGDHPLFRVRLWGTLRVEKWVGGCYEAVKTTDWGGSNYPRLLLKGLLCCPERSARREALLEMLWPEMGWEQATANLNTATTKLRTLLRPVRGQESLLITEDDAILYHLPAQEVLWTDSEAALDKMECAERLGRTTREALPLLEEAIDLSNRGPFLEGEEGQWAAEKRATRELERYRGRLWLVDNYVQQALFGRAETILQTLRENDPLDEDVLCRLLGVLQRQGMIHQALRLYETACHFFAEEGLELTEATQAVARCLQTGDAYKVYPAAYLLSPFHVQLAPTEREAPLREVLDTFALPRGFSTNHDEPLDATLPTSSAFPMSSFLKTDEDVLASLRTVLSGSSVDEKVLVYFDQQTRLFWRAREETALSAQILYSRVVSHLDDITALLARSQFPRVRSSLCEIICRTVLLAGILLYDMGYYTRARQHYQLALQAAAEAHVPLLQAIVWGWVSFTWTYTRQYQEALHCIQQARFLAKQTASPMTQVWLGAIEAEIQAHVQNRVACLQAFDEIERRMSNLPTQDISYLFEFNPTLFLGYKGVCLQQFYRRDDPSTSGFLQASKEALEAALESVAPLKRKLYYLSDLASVYARQGEIERACAYAAQTIPLVLQVGHGSKTIRKHLLSMRMLLQSNEHTPVVQALDEQMAPLLLEMQKEDSSSFA